jgi:hypothetical protein
VCLSFETKFIIHNNKMRVCLSFVAVHLVWLIDEQY